MFLENYIKRALKGSEYKISSRIDGSTEVFFILKTLDYKKPMTIVNKVDQRTVLVVYSISLISGVYHLCYTLALYMVINLTL